MDKRNITVYAVLILITACLVFWIMMISPWNDDKKETGTYAAETYTAAAEEKVSYKEHDNEEAPVATATPTPYVKKTANDANQGCIGDKGLVW